MNKKLLTVKVAVDRLTYGCDILYSYNVPEELQDYISIGRRVVVPFGKSNSRRMGFVMGFGEKESRLNLKNIYAVPDSVPHVFVHIIPIIKWIKEQYFCSYFDAAKLFFPPGISSSLETVKYRINYSELSKRSNLNSEEQNFLNNISSLGKESFSLKKLMSCKIKNCNKILQSFISENLIIEEFFSSRTVGERTIKIFRVVSDNFNEKVKFTIKQKKVCEFLKEFPDSTLKEICYFTGVGESVVSALLKKGTVEIINQIEYRSPEIKDEFLKIDKYSKPMLSSEQNRIFQELLNSYKEKKYEVSLLHGVTGSGKTEVLLNLVDYIISENKSVIFMVPEIALTVQFVKLFRKRYGSGVSIIHSGLTAWERFDSWKRIKSGKAKVVLGTRSAVFAPVENLGLVIIDEEHEFTYKSESTPRFNAKDVAKSICKLYNAGLVLSSATPCIESYYNAKTGKYKLYSLKNRYGEAVLPQVKLIDMNVESSLFDANSFSNEFIYALKENIKDKKQSMIFLNRRGYNTFAKCKNCGEVVLCPNCSVSLHYHKSNDRLMCHYCGYSREFSTKCAYCFQDKIYYLGTGTQKIEDDLKVLIPEARILRMDSDTKNLKGPFNKEFQKFYDGEYDILIGTQMISKGLNFPNLTLVGVLCADQYLYGGDFRSYEKAFSLITQAVGRAGRNKYLGKALIQTFTPENEILKLASSQDYETFFNQEIKIRKAMLYPPFADICIIGFVSENENRVYSSSLRFFEQIKKVASKDYKHLPLRIFPPRPGVIKKIAGKYRYRIVLKCRNNIDFRKMISVVFTDFSKESNFKDVHTFIDINPDTIL